MSVREVEEYEDHECAGKGGRKGERWNLRE